MPRKIVTRCRWIHLLAWPLIVAVCLLGGCGDEATGVECSAGQTDCGGKCVDVSLDPANCGRCGGACNVAGGTAGCSNGVCVIAACSTPHENCDGNFLTGCEADLGSDRLNCGGCGNACAGGEVCENGSCASGCSGELTDCGGNCVNTSTDTANCGRCGNVCTSAFGTSACSNASCMISSCTAPYDDCDLIYENGCETSLLEDERNCGRCGNACTVADGAPACANSSCAIASCVTPFDDCDRTYSNGCEANLRADLLNCGKCDNVCSAANGAPTCSGSFCAIASCTAPFDDCDGFPENGCEANLLADPENCRVCGFACTGDKACDAGDCVDSCSGDLTNCDRRCLDTDSDLLNCGKCDNPCTVVNGTPECLDGSCAIAACATPFENCDGIYDNGCEADLERDLASCGKCGNVCSAPNGTPVCSGKSCAIATCNAPFDDCDGVLENGCEANLLTDPLNCNVCGEACTDGKACDAGACVDDCSGGSTNCEGSCVDTNTDVMNCGGCGKACSVANGTPACSGRFCVVSSCNPPFEDCDGIYDNGCEIDTSSDAANCGECGKECEVGGGTAACRGGFCAVESCAPPFGDCDGLFDTGCETDTSDDVASCGKCGNACAVVDGTPECLDSSCAIASCDAPFDDCDGLYPNGCEIDTSSDSQNCGSCGRSCATTTGSCQASQCLSGTLCIHAGEMTRPGSYGPGPVYATVCQSCTLGDFSACERFFVCDYEPPQCGGCLSGFAAGAYTVAVFIDTDGNADPGAPLPDSGDAIASSCNQINISGSGFVLTTFIVTEIVP